MANEIAFHAVPYPCELGIPNKALTLDGTFTVEYRKGIVRAITPVGDGGIVELVLETRGLLRIGSKKITEEVQGPLPLKMNEEVGLRIEGWAKWAQFRRRREKITDIFHAQRSFRTVNLKAEK